MFGRDLAVDALGEDISWADFKNEAVPDHQ